MAGTPQTYLAWVDPTDKTFNVLHHVYDESVFAWAFGHKEGGFATLTLTLRNPRIGLLNAGRKLWIWLSDFDGATVRPIFFGRLIGFPDDVFAELVVLKFTAKPLDYIAQRQAVADTMRVSPGYDDLFVSEDRRTDPNAVLEGYPKRWHCSRGENGLPLAVSASDIIYGEDGMLTFGESNVAYAGMSSRLIGPPLASVTINGQVNWTQSGTGPAIYIGTWVVPTFTGSSLLGSWPKQGASLGGGWKVATSYAFDHYGVADLQTQTTTWNWQNAAKKHKSGDTMSVNHSITSPVLHGPFFQQILTEHRQAGLVWPGTDAPRGSTTNWSVQGGDYTSEQTVNIPMHYDATWMVVPMSLIEVSLSLTYEASRKRVENLNFTLTSDIQAVMTLPTEGDLSDAPSEQQVISVPGADVTVPINGVAPMSNSQSAHFFTTERGKDATEHLLLRGRAMLLAGQRVIEVTWPVKFYDLLDCTCRHNATLNDRRFPGGSASGKVVNYTITNANGKRGGTITIGCSIGHGGTVEESAGENDYIDDDYIEEDMYARTGEVVAPPTGDFGYSPPTAIEDDLFRFPLTREQIVISEAWHGSSASQLDIITGKAAPYSVPGLLNNDQQAQVAQTAAEALKQALDSDASWFEISLRPISGVSFEDGYTLETTPLKVRKTIDCEAGSIA